MFISGCVPFLSVPQNVERVAIHVDIFDVVASSRVKSIISRRYVKGFLTSTKLYRIIPMQPKKSIRKYKKARAKAKV